MLATDFGNVEPIGRDELDARHLTLTDLKRVKGVLPDRADADRRKCVGRAAEDELRHHLLHVRFPPHMERLSRPEQSAHGEDFGAGCFYGGFFRT